MGWFIKSVWWLLIMTVCSGNKIFDVFQSTRPQFNWNQMGELIKLCFSERTNPIVITEDLVDAIFGTSRGIDRPSVNIIDSNYKSKNIQIFNPAYPTYILSAKSIDELKALLDALKSSPTWSTTSVFFIIGTIENSCENASKMLQVLWKMDLISSFYVCYESDNQEIMMLYTYNPFTNRTPEPWVEVESTDKPDNQWTLYKQPYINDKSICKSLTYDKTKVLDGHKVKVVGTPGSPYYRRNKNYTINTLRNSSNSNSKAAFFENLFSTLNVTPVINYDRPGLWINNTAFGFLKMLQNGTYDISTDSRPLNEIEHVDLVDMHHQNYFMILTQRKNLVKTIDNYENFLNFQMITVSILILMITFIIIVFNNGRDYRNGFLDIIRLSISSGIEAPLDKLSVRIIFFATTLFISLVFPEIQGQIFSYSTKPERRYPQNLEDLRDFKFNVYYHFLLRNYISEQQVWPDLNDTLLHSFDYYPPRCDKQVLNDSSNACIAPVAFQLFPAIENDLHLAQKKLNHFYVSHWTKKNWVLKKRVDEVVSRFRESGFLDKWDKLDSRDIIKKLKTKEALENSVADYDEIDFENLIPLYIFMILSLVLAILIFVAEIMIAKYKAAQHKRKIIPTLERKVAYVGGRLILIK